MISSSLDNKNQIMMNITPNMRIKISGRMGEYLRYHRENKFKRNEE